MKVWLAGPSGLAPGEQEAPPLAADELRVQVEAACLEPQDITRAKSVAPGGGVVGRVVECGEAATAFAGARVLVAPVAACGECDTCRRGFATVCPTRAILGETIHGGCAESVVAKARWLTRLDTGLEVEGPVAALLAGPALSAYGLYTRAGVSAGELMIVLGEGPTAAILCTLGRSRGVTVVNATGSNASAVVREALHSVDGNGRPQKIFVCDGPESLPAAVHLANPGSIVVVAQTSGSFDVSAIVRSDLTLLGFSYGHPDLMTETAALVSKGELELGPFLSHGEMGASAIDASADAFAAGRCLVLSHGQAS